MKKYLLIVFVFTICFHLFSAPPSSIGTGWTSPSVITTDTEFKVDTTNNYEWPDVSRDGWVVYTVNRNKIKIKKIINSANQSGSPEHTVYKASYHSNYFPPPPSPTTHSEILWIDSSIAAPPGTTWLETENKMSNVITSGNWVWVDATGSADIKPDYVDPVSGNIVGISVVPSGTTTTQPVHYSAYPSGYLLAEDSAGNIYHIGSSTQNSYSGAPNFGSFQIQTSSELKFFVNDGSPSDNVGLYSVKVVWSSNHYPQIGVSIGGDCDPPGAQGPFPYNPPQNFAPAPYYRSSEKVNNGDIVTIYNISGTIDLGNYPDTSSIGSTDYKGIPYVSSVKDVISGLSTSLFPLNTSDNLGQLYCYVGDQVGSQIEIINSDPYTFTVSGLSSPEYLYFYINDYVGLYNDNSSQISFDLDAKPAPPPPPPVQEKCLEVRYPSWSEDGNFIIFQKVILYGNGVNNYYNSWNLSPSRLATYFPNVFSKISVIKVNSARNTFTNPKNGNDIGAGSGIDYDSFDILPKLVGGNYSKREYCWYPHFGNWIGNNLEVLFTKVIRSAKSEKNNDSFLSDPLLNEEGTVNFLKINISSWSGVNTHKILKTEFAQTPPTPTVVSDSSCLSYIMQDSSGNLSDISCGNEKESIVPIRSVHFKDGSSGFMYSEPKGFPYKAVGSDVQGGVYKGTISQGSSTTKIPTRNYFPLVADAYSPTVFYFASGKTGYGYLKECGSKNLARHDEMVTPLNPENGDYFHIRKYDSGSIYYITNGLCYDWWPSVTYDNKLVVYMSDKANAINNTTKPGFVGKSNMFNQGRWGLYITPTKNYIGIPVPDTAVLDRTGNETPPFNPPLKEDNNYGFKAKSGSGIILNSDNGAAIKYGWYLYDKITGITVSMDWNGSSWPLPANPVSECTNVENFHSIGSPTDMELTGINGQKIYPDETNDGNVLPNLSHNMVNNVVFSFPEGGMYRVGFVIYYRKNGMLSRYISNPLKFDVQAIDTPNYPVIAMKAIPPTIPPGGYKEDEPMVFTANSYIFYADITPPVESDGSDAKDGVKPGTVKYKWFVQRWDPSTSSYADMYLEPNFTVISGTNTAVNNFSYTFKSPLTNPGHYKVGIKFKWEEIHWKKDYATSPYDTNKTLGTPKEVEDIARFIIDSNYTGKTRNSFEETETLNPYWMNAKMHNPPNPPPSYLPQIVKDASISCTFQVEDVTPPEIAVLPGNNDPMPNYTGTTGDPLTFEIWVRDNNPMLPMNPNGAVTFYREMTPSAYVPAGNYWKGIPMAFDGTVSAPNSGWSSSPGLNYKWNSDWYHYKVNVTMPLEFKGNNIFRYTVIAKDGSVLQNKNEGLLAVSQLTDDVSSHVYYSNSPDTSVDTQWAYSGCFGTISVNDNDLPSIAVRIKPAGFFSVLAYRDATYHVASIWDTAVDTTGNTIFSYPTDSPGVIFYVHPLDPNSSLLPVPLHPKVKSFPEDLLFKYYIEFNDNCKWKGGYGPMTGGYNFKPSLTGLNYVKIHDPEFVGGISNINTVYPNNDVVDSYGLPVPISVPPSPPPHPTPYFEHLFREPNDYDGDGLIDPGEPVYTIEVGVKDDSGNSRRMQLVFPITKIPVFVNSLEEKSNINKRK